MAETSYFWGGTTVGDHGPYDDDMFSDFIRKLFTMDRTLQGPILGYANALAVNNPAGTTIRVATGAAVVDGKFYESTANEDFAVSAPGGGTNYYTVVLTKDFAAQTVRSAILGPDPAAYPAVTQVDGTTWEIMLAHVTITSGGLITVTDVRSYCAFSSLITSAMLGTGTVVNANLGNASVDALKLATDAVETLKIKALNVTPAKLSAAAFPTTATGDLPVASGAATLGRLGVGTDYKMLMALAGEALKMKWAAIGDLLITATSGWSTSTTSVNYVDVTGSSVTVTLLTASTILAFASSSVIAQDDATATVQIVIDGTVQAESLFKMPTAAVVGSMVNVGMKTGVAAGARIVKLQFKSATAAPPKTINLYNGMLIVLVIPTG